MSQAAQRGDGRASAWRPASRAPEARMRHGLKGHPDAWGPVPEAGGTVVLSGGGWVRASRGMSGDTLGLSQWLVGHCWPLMGGH